MTNRNRYLHIRISDKEWAVINRRMEEAGIKNVSTYVRKITMAGLVVKLELEELKEVSRLMRINANNLNQYAKRANETDSIYLEDIKELQHQQDEIWKLLKEVIAKLASIR